MLTYSENSAGALAITMLNSIGNTALVHFLEGPLSEARLYTLLASTSHCVVCLNSYSYSRHMWALEWYTIIYCSYSDVQHYYNNILVPRAYRPQRGRGHVTAIHDSVPSKLQIRQWFVTNYSNSCCLDCISAMD